LSHTLHLYVMCKDLISEASKGGTVLTDSFFQEFSSVRIVIESCGFTNPISRITSILFHFGKLNYSDSVLYLSKYHMKYITVWNLFCVVALIELHLMKSSQAVSHVRWLKLPTFQGPSVSPSSGSDVTMDPNCVFSIPSCSPWSRPCVSKWEASGSSHKFSWLGLVSGLVCLCIAWSH
jgi:hypothetical protein